MSDLDPTLIPPHWAADYDGEQHKVVTEHGVLDFLMGEVKDEVDRFRQFESFADLPEEVRAFREEIASREKHHVRVMDIGIACEYRAELVAANSPTEFGVGRKIFVGVSALLATNVTLYDQGNTAGTGAPIGLWSVGPNTPPIWFDRGIKCRNGIYLASSVATTVTVYFRDLEDS